MLSVWTAPTGSPTGLRYISQIPETAARCWKSCSCQGRPPCGAGCGTAAQSRLSGTSVFPKTALPPGESRSAGTSCPLPKRRPSRHSLSRRKRNASSPLPLPGLSIRPDAPARRPVSLRSQKRTHRIPRRPASCPPRSLP